MAVSKPKITVEISKDDGLEGFCKLQSLYASILYSFRECHDHCVSSKLLSEEIIRQIDQCAVNFRQLSVDTVTVAKRFSNQFLNLAILFYGDMDSDDNPKKTLRLLSDQARELVNCFKIISQWAAKLCGIFYEVRGDTITEANKNFTDAENEAKSAERYRKSEHETAQSLYREAKKAADKWKTAQVVTSFLLALLSPVRVQMLQKVKDWRLASWKEKLLTDFVQQRKSWIKEKVERKRLR